MLSRIYVFSKHMENHNIPMCCNSSNVHKEFYFSLKLNTIPKSLHQFSLISQPAERMIFSQYFSQGKLLTNPLCPVQHWIMGKSD